MDRFDIYVIRRLLLQLIMFAAVLFAVYWINRSIRVFNSLMTDGQTVATFLEYSLYRMPQALNAILPAAAFCASTYLTYVMFTDRELEVFQGSGMGPFRLLRPYAAFGLITFAVASALLHVVVPAGDHGEQMVSERVRSDVASRRIQAGKFLFPTDDIAIFVGGISEDGNFERVFIHESRKPNRDATYFAQGASLLRDGDMSLLILQSGQMQRLDLDEKSLTGLNFDKLRIEIPVPSSLPSSQTASIKSLPTWSLIGPMAPAGATQEALERLVRSTYSLLFPLLGAAALISAFTRIRLGIAAIGVTGVVLAVFLIGNYGESLTLKEIRYWPSMVAPPAASAVLLLVFLGQAQSHRRRLGFLLPASVPARPS